MTGTDVLFRFGADISAIREANVKIADSVAEAARNSKKSWLEFYATLTMVGHGVRRLAQMFSSAWSQAARFEDAATRLAPLIGGLEQSKALCEELRDQAANGTQSFEQLASVAGRLASVFKSTDNVRRWTKAFHDISAGTGFALAEVVFLLKLGGRRLKVMVMKKIFAFLLLLCSTFVLTGAKAPDSPVMRGGRFYKDECERIWKECYGKISVTQNRSEARYWVFVEKNKSDAKLLISLCDKYRASKPGRWFLSTDPYGIKIAFVQSWLEADITVAFVPEGQERFNWR